MVGANKARLDDFPFDSTLIRLSAGFGSGEWQDDLASLLSSIGVLPERRLIQPQVIWASDDPKMYWKSAQDEQIQDMSESNGEEQKVPEFKNEYYVIHAEGYKYDGRANHAIKPGYSQTERSDVIANILPLLPMLIPDTDLIPDPIPTPTGIKKPRAMRDIGEMTDLKRQPDEMKLLLKRALRGNTLNIVLLYNNPDTLKEMRQALINVCSFWEENAFPPDLDIRIHELEIPDEFHQNLNGSRATAHRDRVRKWTDYLEECLLVPGANLPEGEFKGIAFVERVRDREDGLGLGIYGVIRDACTTCGFVPQMMETLNFVTKDGQTQLKKSDQYRVESAASEIILAHTGALYGPINDLYRAAGIDHELEIIAFHLERTHRNILFPVAVKIASDGAVEACFPEGKPDKYEWRSYPHTAIKLGQFISEQWVFNKFNSKQKLWRQEARGNQQSPLSMSRADLASFVMNVLSSLNKPTIAVIEAINWRNYDTWPQLRNADLSSKRNVLDFNNENESVFEVVSRADPRYANLLGVVRMRYGDETPQYVTDTKREFTQLAGFIDCATTNMFHYISIGGHLENASDQEREDTKRNVRHSTMFNGGAGVAYKAPQAVEFVPFFVHPQYSNDEGHLKLCRVLSYLRVSPSWQIGNVIRPYPMHLGRKLIEDQLDILVGD